MELIAIKELCSGCRMCEIMCSISKSGIANRYYARIRVVTSEEGVHSPVICQQCEDPKCLEACPVPMAMSLNQDIGIVELDDTKCTDCLACVNACPFSAIQVSPEGKILKCDLCGGNPICVKYCPPRPAGRPPKLMDTEKSCLQFCENRIDKKHINRG